MPTEEKKTSPQLIAEEVTQEPLSSLPVSEPTPSPEKRQDASAPAIPKPLLEKNNKIYWFLLLVVLLIVAGILVFFTWFSSKNMLIEPNPVSPVPEQATLPTAEPTPESDEKTAALNDVGTGTDLGSISDDLEKTDLTDLNKELGAIEQELASE